MTEFPLVVAGWPRHTIVRKEFCMRILVVEDDMVIANLLQRALREESYAVDLAHDGIEGEWLATENPYDLIILDVLLPCRQCVKPGSSLLF